MRGVAGKGRNAVRLPLFLTATIHLGALLLALVAPRLIPEHLQIPEVYQVELYSAPEAAPKPQPTPLSGRTVAETPGITAPPPPATAPKVQAKPTITSKVPPPLGRPKAVSLSPIKEGLARDKREREEQAQRNRQVANRVTQLKLDLQQQQAKEQARAAARQYREAIAESYRVTPARPVPVAEGNITKPRTGEAAGQGTAASSKEISAEVQAAYKAGLSGHIGRHWSLPDLQGWDKSLTTVIGIKMKSNGMVASGGITISTSSGNPRFDKEARKAVINSLPLPPLPPEFGKNGEEIVVRFTPLGLK